jgi:2-(1,2-epoxy-1,2-dihydrophenyl)acetyl-CoA isomerase
MGEDRPLDEQVLHHVDGGVAWITLNRPETLNAITAEQRNRVIALLQEASEDLIVRCVVLTATGRGFCTGADLRGARPTAPPRPVGAPDRAAGDVARVLREGSQRLVAAILDCEKPVIAAVNGTAAGMGAHLAFACDLVLAAESARFVEVFVRRGLVPDGGGAWLLPRLIGLQKTKELLFFGDGLSADDAYAIGLVNRVVDDDELTATAAAWAERLADAPTRALALTKWLVNRSLESDRATAFAEEALAQDLNMSTRDAEEGVVAFLERREPDYRGW